MIAATGSEFGGLIGLIAGLLVLGLAIMWLIFPVLVLSKFNELLKVQREIRAALLSANAAQFEIAKALQWMVGNWKIGDANRPHPPPPLYPVRCSQRTFTNSARVKTNAAPI